ncbi:hypothetical protein BTM25_03320 [Actinomadura rubteroloni]|uniref:DUF2795 domain-containing protein n=1 Tax=Actinomadura rubteroloni TaxID=1926885 RepID=A0A2P4ULL5_9ACTN|nr:DUF2795 domain-containing protein [Actinomadura rubteroloni]POM25948.1 hypothetical protein BTM25_03320 [Actinomadura rubteroloni]
MGEIKAALNDMRFPASKDDLVAHASRVGAGEPQVRALRALPLADYANLDEVMRSVPVDPAPDLTTTERTVQHREHRHPNLAEHERVTHSTPIDEELGGE